MSEEKQQWKKTSGFAKETTVAQVVCREDDLEQWDKEVEEWGYSSRSQYLYELIHEARAYREQGFLPHHQSEEQIRQLQQKVETLEQELEKKEKRDSGHVRIDDSEFLFRFLDHRRKTLDEILREIVESGALDDLIRKPVEDQLYFLASQDRVEYERGHGWTLAANGGDH